MLRYSPIQLQEKPISKVRRWFFNLEKLLIHGGDFHFQKSIVVLIHQWNHCPYKQ
jgi:hypothetical protein